MKISVRQMEKESPVIGKDDRGFSMCVLRRMFLNTSIYRKIYFSTNRSARMYINGVIFFALPQTRLTTT